jgi:metallo-beta-lactamase family protein
MVEYKKAVIPVIGKVRRFDLLKEETLPLAEPMEEIMLPYFRELNEALAELKKQEADLLAVVQRLENAGKEKTLEEKRAQRLTNAINRLASDLEYLKIKWGVDAD